MSEKENLPEDKFPPKEHENLEKKGRGNGVEAGPAEHLVEKPSQQDSPDDMENALLDEAEATTRNKDSERMESPESSVDADHPDDENRQGENREENSSESFSETDNSSEKKSEEADSKMATSKLTSEGNSSENTSEATEKKDDGQNLSSTGTSGNKEEKIAENEPASDENEDFEGEAGSIDSVPIPKDAQAEVEDAVAEDSEDESTGERHGIEKKDYHAMSKEALVKEFERLLKNEKVQAIKDHVDEIRAEFNAKFDEEMEEKKEEFLADGGNIIDFHYSSPLRKEFNSLYFDYREKRNKYYQQLKQDLNKNLERRLEIIEELKGLIDVEENINTTYKHFRELQDRWRTAGAIPRDKYNTVWNTYHHHVENFYDFLHLNREFRDLDFKHNLEQKLKIISRAEELTQETDVNRAFRELQMLHKMWKEDLGPVDREYRDDIWQKFSEATKKIHDKRQEYFEKQEKNYEKNLERKEEIIEKINLIAAGNYTAHKQWQQQIKEVEALREQFFNAGKVPKQSTDQTWKRFKEAVRSFNRNKNNFYKIQKKEQYENLEKKKELVKIAKEHQDSEDFKETTPLMKKIQDDWKKIGHVPRKDSDKIWKEFKVACNHYFERLHASRNEENTEEAAAYEKKKDLLEKLKNLELSSDRKNDLPTIKNFIEEWKNAGRVPHGKRFIEGKFNKALDHAFNKLDMDKKQSEMLKYENKIQALEDTDDNRKIDNEHYFLTKKVEETKAEIRQLENNLQFFSNVDDKNPLVQEVHKNINNQKEQLRIWKEKLEKVKSLY